MRVLRLGRLISYMYIREDYKLSLKIGRLIFFLIIYLHMVGCLWHFLIKQDEEWLPPLDYVWIETHFFEYDIPTKDYLSLYHSVLMLTGNDCGPRGNYQVIFLTIVLTLGAIVNAQLFGELAIIVSTLNVKS